MRLLGKILNKLHNRFPQHIPIMTDWVYEQMRGERKMFITKKDYDYYKELEKEVARLQLELSECRYENNAIKNRYLGEFEFAIVKEKDKPYVDVWMDKHPVKKIREIALHQQIGEVPELIIKK